MKIKSEQATSGVEQSFFTFDPHFYFFHASLFFWLLGVVECGITFNQVLRWLIILHNGKRLIKLLLEKI